MPQRRSIFRESDPEWADKRGIGEGPRPAFGPIGQDRLGKRGSSDRKEEKFRRKRARSSEKSKILKEQKRANSRPKAWTFGRLFVCPAC